MEIILVIIVAYALYLITWSIVYKNTGYQDISGLKFYQVMFDKGNKGEFNIFKALKNVEGYKKIFANIYIPKDDGTTSEVDLVLVHEKGIIAIESKNYSGWIYGKESDYKWVQVFNKRSKFKFYNPILQNKNHIKYLSLKLEDYYKHEYFSLIVFGNDCKLKKVSNSLTDVLVIQQAKVKRTLNKKFLDQPILLTEEEVDLIGSHLETFSNVSDEVKAAHIKSVQNVIRNTDKNYRSNKTKRKFGLLNLIGNRRLLGLLLLGAIMLYSNLNNPPSKLDESQSVDINVRETTIADSTDKLNLVNNTINPVVVKVSTTQVSESDNIEKESLSLVVSDESKEESTDAVINIVPSENEDETNLDVIEESNETLVEEDTVVENESDLDVNITLVEHQILISGISSDVVLSIYGSPTSIPSSQKLEWTYQNSKIWFDENMIVVGWSNYNNQLDAGMLKPTSQEKMITGISSSEVLEIFGSPTSIPSSQKFEWHYQNSKVWFDKSFIVIGWDNYNNQLTKGLLDRGEGTISIGSTKDDILEVLGSPSKIIWMSQNDWYYGTSKLSFNDNVLVTIYDPRDNLIEYILK